MIRLILQEIYKRSIFQDLYIFSTKNDLNLPLIASDTTESMYAKNGIPIAQKIIQNSFPINYRL